MIGLIKSGIKRALPPSVWESFRARSWRYVRPLTVDYCPIMLPWFAGARRDDGIGRLHRLATSFHWRDTWSATTAAAVSIAALRWPFMLLWDSVSAFRRYGSGVRARHGVGRTRQALDIVRLGVGSNVPALYYYRFRLFDPANARRASAYLHAEEMNVLYPTLSVELPSDVPVRHKEAFYEAGRKAGLPVVPAIATFADGRALEWYASARQLPPVDLVLKPVDMACGRGFQRWAYDNGGQTWQRGDQRLTAEELLAYCGRASIEHRHILQARLTNHRALADLSGDGLSTIRVVTFRRPSGESGTLLACLRMPTGALLVDNFEAGGIAAPIDLATGTLGAAVAKDPRRGTFTRHPDSGAPIEGYRVPYFGEALHAALTAHAAFPWLPFVGWDVVITDDGPLLLEGNPDWCVELAQIVTNTPLGETLYPEIYLEHLAAQRQRKSRADAASEPGQARGVA